MTSEYKIVIEIKLKSDKINNAIEEIVNKIPIEKYKLIECTKLLTPKEELLKEIRKCYNSSDYEIEYILEKYEVKKTK